MFIRPIHVRAADAYSLYSHTRSIVYVPFVLALIFTLSNNLIRFAVLAITQMEVPPIPSNSEAHSTESHPLFRVSVKQAPFYRSNPEFWLRQLESQFELAAISSDKTRYFHLISQLPEDIGSRLICADESYAKVKDELLAIFSKTKEERIEAALGEISLDGEKPSIAARRIRRILTDAGLDRFDDIAKSKLMSCLPINVKTALAPHQNLPFDDFAKVADSIYMYATHEPQINLLRGRPATEQGMKSNPVPYGLRPYKEGQKPVVCRSHLYMGLKGYCKFHWCQFPRKESKNNVSPGNGAAAQS